MNRYGRAFWAALFVFVVPSAFALAHDDKMWGEIFPHTKIATAMAIALTVWAIQSIIALVGTMAPTWRLVLAIVVGIIYVVVSGLLTITPAVETMTAVAMATMGALMCHLVAWFTTAGQTK